MEDNKKQQSGNYPEDYHLENGNYENICKKCGDRFFSYKRRVICKVCNIPNQPEHSTESVPSALEYYNENWIEFSKVTEITKIMEGFTSLCVEQKKRESIKKIEQLIKSCDKNCPKETIRAYSVVLKILNHE